MLSHDKSLKNTRESLGRYYDAEPCCKIILFKYLGSASTISM